MPQAAIPAAIIGTSLISGHQQRKAQESASRVQERSSAEEAAVLREAMRQARMATEPFRFGAQQSINPLLQSLGLQPTRLPSQPVFNLFTGLPQNASSQPQDRRSEIEARLSELRAIRGGS